ncbi:MAG: hypothetical protein ABEJ61_09540 [Haloferacaceae archaeon]
MGERVDLAFPACCAHCPHRQSFTASCSHELRQSFVRELDDGRTCPVYADAKTATMRRLADSL